jgi:hypothetical protein
MDDLERQLAAADAALAKRRSAAREQSPEGRRFQNRAADELEGAIDQPEIVIGGLRPFSSVWWKTATVSGRDRPT